MAQYPQRPGEADNCRDFLRTGRCKYGESCKYHHPPNVQNGGGVRTPLDPSEPPFPIRPNEPPCQYFLKHGTCKFGQTCKFHHPPLSPKQQQAAALYGQTVVSSTSSLLTSLDLLLPQRPSEPDCIYFLRNGRCKYGATCKYHHPMPLHVDDATLLVNNKSISGPGVGSPRERSQSGGSMSDLGGSGTLLTSVNVNAIGVNGGSSGIPVQFLSSQGHSTQGPTHIILNDGSIAVMVNPNPPAHHASNGGSLSNSPFQNRSNSGQFYHSNSSPVMYSPVFSSVSSSYEAPSNLEFIGGGGADLGNANSGHVETVNVPTMHSSRLASSAINHHHSLSHGEVNVGQLQPSSPGGGGSYRSENDVSPSRSRVMRVDASENMANLKPPELSFRNGGNAHSPSSRVWLSGASLSPSARIWDGPGASGGSGFAQNSLYSNEPDLSEGNSTFADNMSEAGRLHPSLSAPSNLSDQGIGTGRHVWTGSNEQSVGQHAADAVDGNWDDGLSTMTSALLNMLDTPEERKATPPLHVAHSQQSISSPVGRQLNLDGGMPPIHPSRTPELSATRQHIGNPMVAAGTHSQQGTFDFLSGSSAMSSGTGVGPVSPPSMAQLSPTWQGAAGQQVQHKPPVPTSPNVGLFLS